MIDTPILNEVDADMPSDELHFVIAVPPRHGQIVQQLSTSTVSVHKYCVCSQFCPGGDSGGFQHCV